MNLFEALNTFQNAYEAEDSPLAANEESDKESFTSALSTITGKSNKQMDKMLQMFEGMNKRIDALVCQKVNDKDNKENINPRTGRPFRRYCWSHGCCDHWSNRCPQRKPGHKLNATFKNRMSGSTDGVLGA